jgi:tetratricopeptide (TPR) repeat protein
LQENESKRRWNAKKVNLIAIAIACLVALFLFAYYHLSPTYVAAREAKALYERGSFDEALEKAQTVYAENPYNVLAYSVLEQSKKAVRWKRFVVDSQGYSLRIRVAIAQKNPDPVDMLMTKMMLETALHDYGKLGDSDVIWDRELVKEANEYYREFAALYEKLFGGANR